MTELLSIDNLHVSFPTEDGIVKAVDGVSLTVNRVEDLADACRFSINLIPHTVEVTTLKHLKASSKVNLEIDVLARYLKRMEDMRAR
mgnify:CR=1 FL=1